MCTLKPQLTGELMKFFRLFRCFLMWFFNPLESSGFRSSKLHNSSDDTDITAPQLSNSPQYCFVSARSQDFGGCGETRSCKIHLHSAR